MPPLMPHERDALRFLAEHLAVGLLAGLLLFALLLAGDLFGLRQLMLDDGRGWLAALLLLFGLCVTFGSLAMGIGIMGLARDRSD